MKCYIDSGSETGNGETQKWTMPNWMREALLICGYQQYRIDDADQYYCKSEQKITQEGRSEGWDCLADTILDLVNIHSASLLLTREQATIRNANLCVYCGERIEADTDDEQDRLLREHIEVCEKHPVTRLRAENERLRGMLGTCRDAINAQPEDAFGFGGNEGFDSLRWPIKHELLLNINTALGADHD